MQKNPVCFWELASHDADKSVKFFRKVFGWKFQYDENTTIHELPAGDAASEFWGGGVFTLRKSKLPFLTIYILVDDIEAKAGMIEDAGGLIVEPVMDLPSGSKICLFNEPSGVTFAMLQPGTE
jgi:predicted enzyme related to lactoylglutathione lyase